MNEREKLIITLAEFLDTFPEGCSSYHICDMLVSKLEKIISNKFAHCEEGTNE